MKIPKAVTATVTGLATVAVLAACANGPVDDGYGYATEDCDAEDLAHFEDDCGYWDTHTGQFVLWYWVTPGYGGYRPGGWHPYMPSYGSHHRPPNANTKAKPTPQARPQGAPSAKPVPTGGNSKRPATPTGAKPPGGVKPDGGRAKPPPAPKPPAVKPAPPAPKPAPVKPPKVGK